MPHENSVKFDHTYILKTCHIYLSVNKIASQTQWTMVCHKFEHGREYKTSFSWQPNCRETLTWLNGLGLWSNITQVPYLRSG